jgi:predicted RNA-binding protein YlxR (DUF448 family)
MHRRSKSERTAPERTCVGCGLRDAAAAMVRLVVAEDEVAFDLAGSAFGRGAHLHARPDCLEKAPRGLARTFKRDPKVDARELGVRLTAACDRRMAGLMLAARRTNALAVGSDASLEAFRRGAPLLVVAIDAGSIAHSLEVKGAVVEGRAIAWKTKADLGGLLWGHVNDTPGLPEGRLEEAVAICAVRHAGIADELKMLRAAADAAAVVTREGAECSRRPEAP